MSDQIRKVKNCKDCLLSKAIINDNSIFYGCCISSGSIIVYDDDSKPYKIPPPDNCPLKTGKVIIQLD